MEIHTEKVPLKDVGREWDVLNDNSPHGSIFNSLNWLRFMDKHHGDMELICIYSEGELVGGVAGFVSSKKGSRISQFSYTNDIPYAGIIFSEKILHFDVNSYKQVMACLVNSLSSYSRVSFMCSPEFTDIRWFKWGNWELEPRFTYRFKLASMDNMYKRMDKQTKDDIQKGEALNLELSESDDIEILNELLIPTYGWSSWAKPQAFLEDLVSMIRENKSGSLYLCVDKNEKVNACAVILWDKKRAYGFYNCLRQGAEIEYSWMWWKVFELLNNKQIENFDWCGANLLYRVKYKQNFVGPEVKTFFEVEKSTFLSKTVGRSYGLMKRLRII